MNSQKGASIFFALFAFLVCAAVGSVILASGSAASGRIARLAETDQRYHSAMSAARLFRDAIEGESITVTKTMVTTTTETDTITKNAEGKMVHTAGIPEDSVAYEDVVIEHDGIAIGDGASFPLDFAIALVLCEGYDEAGNLKETYETDYPDTIPNPVTRNFVIIPDQGEKVNVEAVLSPDKTLAFIFSAPQGASGAYRVKLVFEAQIDESTNEITSAPEQTISGSEENYTKETVTTDTVSKITKVTWVFSHVEDNM